jgi:hypothetical protein
VVVALHKEPPFVNTRYGRYNPQNCTGKSFAFLSIRVLWKLTTEFLLDPLTQATFELT